MRMKCVECYVYMVLSQKLRLNREIWKCPKCKKEVLIDYNEGKKNDE